MFTRLAAIILITSLWACSASKKMDQQKKDGDSNLLYTLMQSRPAMFGEILKAKDSLNVQIIYTQINRDANNNPSFKDYTFNLNNSRYFYPASTVKLPVALLALEKLNILNIEGLSRTTSMITDSNYSAQEYVFTDPKSADARPTIEQYIKEILLVSDNDAFNRLYEFLGQEYINEQLHKKEYTDAEILHRLNISLTEEENRHTNGITFYDTSGNIVYSQPPAYNTKKYSQRNTFYGVGYYAGGSLIHRPFDFSKKNRLYLSDLHQVLRSVIFPAAVPAKQRFNLKDDDYSFLYKYMSMIPGESTFPQYDTASHWPAYAKFLLYGSQKGALIPHLRIFNKIGGAYGFLTDVAYVADFKNKTEFFLTATILCNSNGIFNDDHYDYDTVGFPFMKNLGQVIYEYELQRKKDHLPDLSRFIFNYEK